MKPLSRKSLIMILIVEIIFFVIIVFNIQGLFRENDDRNCKNVPNAVVEAFNSRFESFEKTDATATDVRAIYASIISNNAAERHNSSDHFITINEEEVQRMPKDLSREKTYTIKLEKDENTGYVKNCIIIPNK